MRLFRFFDSTGGLATLKSLRLRFKDPRSFNDPFELTPRLPPDPAQRRKLFEFVGGLDSFWQYHDAELVRFSLLESFAQSGRLLCLSKKSDDILMWSHYAENHKGLVLEIETDLLRDEQFFFETIEVDYQCERPLLTGLHDFQIEGERILRTKAKVWEYEQEVRILVPVFDGMKVVDGHHELPINAACIKRVILGCESHQAKENEFERSIKDLLARPEFAHVERHKAYRDRDCFKLVFEPLKLD